MNPVVLRTALEDIERGYAFYESQETGLGAHFEDSIFSDIANLKELLQNVPAVEPEEGDGL